MQANKRFYYFALIFMISLAVWLLTFDNLLLGIWMIILLILSGAYIFTRQSLKGVDLKRYSRVSSLEAGDIFDERIEIRNDSRTGKLWIQIQDQSVLFSHIHTRTITKLGSGKVRVHQARALVNRRGVYSLGPVRLISGDPFGFFTSAKTIPARSSLTVYPHIEHITHLAMEPGREIGGQNLLVQTTRTTPQAAGVREYQPGDPLNRIHWPITIKKECLMVKEFDEDTQSCAWIFLDAQEGIYPHSLDAEPPAFDWNMIPLKQRKPYQIPCDGFEYAVSIASSLADYFTRNRRAFGFAAIGKKLVILPAEKGERQLHKILKELSTIEDEGRKPLEQLITGQVKNISRGSLAIIITPKQQSSIRDSLKLMERWGVRTQVIQIVTQSFGVDKKTSQAVNYINENEIMTLRQAQGSLSPNKIDLIRISYGDEISAKLG